MQKKLTYLGLNLLILTALLITPYYLLRPYSPNFINGRLSQVSIMPNGERQLTINGRDFVCFPQEGVTSSCETFIDGKLLQIRHKESEHTAGSCTVIFENHVIEQCRASYWLGHSLPVIAIDHNLGIPTTRYTQLRREAPLFQWQEADWLRAANLTIGFVTLLAIGWFWTQTRQSTLISTFGRKIIFTLSTTAVTSFLFFIASIFTLLNLNLID